MVSDKSVNEKPENILAHQIRGVIFKGEIGDSGQIQGYLQGMSGW